MDHVLQTPEQADEFGPKPFDAHKQIDSCTHAPLSNEQDTGSSATISPLLLEGSVATFPKLFDITERSMVDTQF